MIALLLALLLSLTQDDLDERLRGLATRLPREGVSGKLADVVTSNAGLQAIREKIDALVADRVGRIERDPIGHYEDWLFSTDANGDLHLRPERRGDAERLNAKLPDALKAMATYTQRCVELAARLDPENPLDRRARAAWGDSGFRVAFFHRHPAELRERSDAELLDDGIGEPLEATLARLDAVKTYEKSCLQQVAKVEDPAARALLSSDHGLLFVIGRALRQIEEGWEHPIGAIDEQVPEGALILPDLSEALVRDVRDGERLLEALRPLLDARVHDLADEGRRETLKNERVRVLLAERVHGLRQQQRLKGAEILDAVLADGFTVEGDKVTVKKGRYVDDEGKDSVERLGAELDAVIAEFEGAQRGDLDRIAERCIDPALSAVFENRAGTYLLLEHREEAIARMIEAERARGFERFAAAYLEKRGDAYVVRPDRSARVEAILRRAEALRKEQ